MVFARCPAPSPNYPHSLLDVVYELSGLGWRKSVPASGKVMKLDLGPDEMSISSDMAIINFTPPNRFSSPAFPSTAREACGFQLRSL